MKHEHWHHKSDDAELTCSACGRHPRGRRDYAKWNTELRAGRIVRFLCPDCQTPEQNAEAEINTATLVYERDAFGRVLGRPKIGAAS